MTARPTRYDAEFSRFDQTIGNTRVTREKAIAYFEITKSEGGTLVHDALIKEHQQVIARHDAVLKRHAELEANHESGRVSDAQMQQDHATMKAEDQQIQQEHKKLVDDHAEMMAEHKALLAKAGKA